MVCPRCIMSVKAILEELSIPFSRITLGQVDLVEELSIKQSDSLAQRLHAIGFELLDPGKSSLISKIKTAIIRQVNHFKDLIAVNFSTLIADRVHHEPIMQLIGYKIHCLAL